MRVSVGTWRASGRPLSALFSGWEIESAAATVGAVRSRVPSLPCYEWEVSLQTLPRLLWLKGSCSPERRGWKLSVFQWGLHPQTLTERNAHSRGPLGAYKPRGPAGESPPWPRSLCVSTNRKPPFLQKWPITLDDGDLEVSPPPPETVKQEDLLRSAVFAPLTGCSVLVTWRENLKTLT